MMLQVLRTLLSGGSLFLFDRKVLRYFRKDGHNWRKKKDGKTVREAHERLKAGSVDVLHCYYAHGEENENFQRRSYWMLEEDFEHIVLVHYREVKGSKTSFVRANDSQRISANVEMSSPACSSSHPSVQSPLSTNTSGLSASHALEYEEVESCGPQVTSRYQSQFEMQPSEDRFFLVQNVPGILQGQMNYSLNGKGDHQQKRFDILQSSFMSAVNYQQKQIDLSSWEAVLKQCTPGFQVSSNEHADGSGHSFGIEGTSSRDDKSLVELTEGQSAATTWPISAQLHKDFHEATALDGQKGQRGDVEVYLKEQCLLSEDKFQKQHKDSENTSNTETALIKKEPDCLAEGEGLKKLDSFCRWMSKEFGDVDESLAPPKLGLDWYVEENTDMGVDADLLSPSISQEQLFSIDDFSPNWLYAGVKSKVLVTGTFLNNHRSLCKWSCMFGEVEVPAEVIAPGVLRCFAPRHEVGRVPFYVTCSNRLACSEVREFEFRANKLGAQTSEGFIDKINETRLQVQLAQMLSLGAGLQLQHAEVDAEHLSMCNKIRSLLKDDEDEYFQGNVYMTDISGQVQDKLLQQLMKGKLLDWLLVKAIEDGKGPNVLDKEGQGVLHLACALGYDWAIAPMLAAGVNINFRDVHGWTALHWAAFCGRERTVVALVTMGGAPGALTDPTPHFPSGQTPADLASTNGHKGIAGYLAESSLTSHLSTLTLKETLKDGRGPANSSETAVLWDGSIKDLGEGDTENGSSLKDSLAAVRTATQAAARIHQVFRLQSFQRKQLIKHGDDGCGILEEHALSRLSGHKAQRVGHHDEPVHFAAIKIQKKFRGWKGRKEFLIIRQRIVKIQAHVRGHQVRKHLRKIVWTVGIVEKAILRWRRKGIGLRGFRSDGLIDGPAIQSDPSKSDDDDFLREGRRQTEARLDKALARVKSMVQYPDARDQYRRLLNVVTEFEDSKVEFEKVLSEAEAIEIDDVVIFETEEEDGISMFTSV